MPLAPGRVAVDTGAVLAPGIEYHEDDVHWLPPSTAIGD